MNKWLFIYITYGLMLLFIGVPMLLLLGICKLLVHGVESACLSIYYRNKRKSKC